MDSTQSSFIPLSMRLSGSALKILALISMIADHCAYYLLEHDTLLYDVMRCFGRMAFPVFAFLVAEGFANSRNRLRYFLMLAGFGVISEWPWQMLNGSDGTHNVLFTLALGVAALALFDRLCEHAPLAFMSVVIPALFAWLLGTDYEWRGVLMIVLFYILRFRTIRPWLERHQVCHSVQALLQLLFTFPLMIHYGLAGAIFAGAVIFLYDGSRGFIRSKATKYAFYTVYPINLIIIVLMY